MRFSILRPTAVAWTAAFLFCILCCNTALAEDTRQTLTDQRDQAQQAYKEAQQALDQMESEQQQTQSQIEDLQGQAADIAGQLDAIYAALQEADRQLLERQADEQAAKKAFEEASEALDAFVRAQSDRYTTQDLILTSLDFRCPLDSYSSITTQFGEADPPPGYRLCRPQRYPHLRRGCRRNQRRRPGKQLRQLRTSQSRHRQ